MTAPAVTIIFTIEARLAVRAGYLSDRHLAKVIAHQGPIPPGATVRLILGRFKSLSATSDLTIDELGAAGRVMLDGAGPGLLELHSRLTAAWA